MRLFICAIFAFFIVLPIYLIKSAANSNPQKQKAESERLKKIAIERGHVVTARFIDSQAFSVQQPCRATISERVCIYEYYYKGKRYKYRFTSEDAQPTLTLYFVSNPRKAAVDLAITDSKVSWPLVYVIVAALLYLLTRG